MKTAATPSLLPPPPPPPLLLLLPVETTARRGGATSAASWPLGRSRTGSRESAAASSPSQLRGCHGGATHTASCGDGQRARTTTASSPSPKRHREASVATSAGAAARSAAAAAAAVGNGVAGLLASGTPRPWKVTAVPPRHVPATGCTEPNSNRS